MSDVRMYTTAWCPYCIRARRLLDGKGVSYEDIRVDTQPELRAEMMDLSGRHTVPQIWVGDTHVGGFTDLAALEHNGSLDQLLASA